MFFSMDVLGPLSSEEACSRLFKGVRWVDGVYCPRCGSRRVKGHGNYRYGFKRYFCKDCNGLSWLLSRSPMTIFKALKKLMLRLRDKASRVEFSSIVEVNELYINA